MRYIKWLFAAVVLLVLLVVTAAFIDEKVKESGNTPIPVAAITAAQPVQSSVPAITTPAAVIRTPVSKANDPWARIRDCDVVAVAVLTHAGEFKPGMEAFRIGETSDRFEQWTLAIYREDLIHVMSDKDMWGNPYRGRVWATRLEDLPTGSVRVYNVNGLFATGSNVENGRVYVGEPLYCKNPKSDQYDWSPQENTTRLGAVKFAEGDQSRVFESTFYVGRKLNDDELRSLIAMTRRVGGSFWQGTGEIGGSRFMSGRLNVDPDGVLYWKWNNQEAKFLQGIHLPLEAEIYVDTLEQSAGSKPTEKRQRFVLWKSAFTSVPNMIEPDRPVFGR